MFDNIIYNVYYYNFIVYIFSTTSQVCQHYFVKHFN